MIKNLCVYCGAATGTNEKFNCYADHFGALLAKHQIGLVFGGGSTGLMGTLAKAVKREGGYVQGVIPSFLVEMEVAFTQADELIVTKDMHERKMQMFERAEGFVALSGGIGTLEEIIEVLTWSQLRQHKKPIVIANLDNYWTPLIDLLDQMRDYGFIRAELGIERGVQYEVVQDVNDIIPTLMKLRNT